MYMKYHIHCLVQVQCSAHRIVIVRHIEQKYTYYFGETFENLGSERFRHANFYFKGFFFFLCCKNVAFYVLIFMKTPLVVIE